MKLTDRPGKRSPPDVALPFTNRAQPRKSENCTVFGLGRVFRLNRSAFLPLPPSALSKIGLVKPSPPLFSEGNLSPLSQSNALLPS